MIDRNDAPKNLIATEPKGTFGNIRLCQGCHYYTSFGLSACLLRLPYPGILARLCSPKLRADGCYVIFVEGWIYKHKGD